MLKYALPGIFAAVVAAEPGIEGIICPDCEYMISLVYHTENDTRTPQDSWMPAFNFTLDNSPTNGTAAVNLGDQDPGLYTYNFNEYEGELQDRRMYVAAAAAPSDKYWSTPSHLLNCTFTADNTGNGIVFMWWDNSGTITYTANPTAGVMGGPTHVNCAHIGSGCPATGSSDWSKWSSEYPYGASPANGTGTQICAYKLQDIIASGAATVGASTLGLAIAIVAASIVC